MRPHVVPRGAGSIVDVCSDAKRQHDGSNFQRVSARVCVCVCVYVCVFVREPHSDTMLEEAWAMAVHARTRTNTDTHTHTHTHARMSTIVCLSIVSTASFSPMLACQGGSTCARPPLI